MSNPAFISFEGIEGSGKTTVLRRIETWCHEHRHTVGTPDVVVTREPGGTSIGRHIRSWLLDPGTTFYHPYSEFLMFMADRMEHVAHVIKPALANGKTVLCDRFADSTLAYQVGGRGLSRAIVDALHHEMGIWPDCTILLDVAPEEGLRRAQMRAKLDRFESEAVAFHQRVRAYYHHLATEYPHRIICIDTTPLSPDDVYDRVMTHLQPFLTASKQG